MIDNEHAPKQDRLFDEMWRRFALASSAFEEMNQREHTVQKIAHAATSSAWWSEVYGPEEAFLRIGGE